MNNYKVVSASGVEYCFSSLPEHASGMAFALAGQGYRLLVACSAKNVGLLVAYSVNVGMINAFIDEVLSLA